VATIGDKITDALQDLGVVAAGDTPSNEDSALALSRVNDWIDSLGTDGPALYTVARTTWTITANDGSYTVGAGADVNVARPVSPNGITVRLIDTSADPDLEMSLGELLTEAEYAGIPQKALTSPYPQRAHYNPTHPSGTLTFWPVPTSSTLLGVLYARTPISEFASLATTFSLPPGYRRWFRAQLAIEIAPAFDATPSEAILLAARESQSGVKRSNTRRYDLVVDTIGQRAQYDINAGP
jgi:hypothetical protein